MVDAALSTGKYDTICITHNETSTGIQNPVEDIAEVLRKYPDVVWCMDAVSSAAGSRIETDKLGVDVLVTSTQKALALPPGMAVCTLSPKAYERTASVPNRGCYFDLRSIYDTIQKKDYQYTNTPCVSIMYAMDLQLQRIMQEGVDNRFARHEAMAEFVRSWADEYFSVFANRDHLSRTLTVISNTRNIDVAALNQRFDRTRHAAWQRLRRLEEQDVPHRPHGRTDDGRHAFHHLQHCGHPQDLAIPLRSLFPGQRERRERQPASQGEDSPGWAFSGFFHFSDSAGFPVRHAPLFIAACILAGLVSPIRSLYHRRHS